MKTKNATAPRWASDNTEAIDLTVEIEGIGLVPFTASPDDPEPHGRDLWERAKAGEFGHVAEFVPAPGPDAATVRRGEIVTRLAKIDAESVRALRVTVASQAKGKPAPAFDLAKLEALETEADNLRAELAALGA